MAEKKKEHRNDWLTWLLSGEGQNCANFDSLKHAADGREYLENRLWWAFTAGVRAAQKERAAK